ncbi:MAG TPA: PKD domain-containing protein [candidate division Zixibacteria bacterium]|nr:PKD domain-containing protein [candidate division Zixibacteria bacterium]
MKYIVLLILFGALALPASASTVISWTQTDISGYNLTLKYTSSFSVSKTDTLQILIRNVGNESNNDTITVNEINITDTSKATGSWTGSRVIKANSSEEIPFNLNIINDVAGTIYIKIYYNVSLDNKVLDVTAHYPGQGAPRITPWNNKTNNDATTIAVNISEVIRFNATSNQTINTWNWSRDEVNQINNNDYFIASWNGAGTKTIKVNATNVNGTSNTITWTVTVNAPSGVNKPAITSWNNSKTNNSDLSLTLNETDTVKFNFTANQTLTSWSWKLNGNTISSLSNTLTHTFNNHGSYKLNASGSNDNGSTQTVVWNIVVLEKEGRKKNATLLTWYPQVVDYVEVNGTLSQTIEYSITTVEEMTLFNWTVDGMPVTGYADGNTYYYEHTWNNSSRLGAHTIIFKGSDSDTRVEFRWYVNVYREGTYSGGDLFEIIDDALENHITDIKIRMFKNKIAKHGGKSAIAAQKVNQLHNEIAKRQMTREALRAEFKAGNITAEEYAAAMKQVQRDAKYNSKLAKGYAKIAKEDLKDDESEKDFKKISSEIEEDNDKKKDNDRKKDNDKKYSSGKKSKSNGKDKEKDKDKKGHDD